MSHFEHFSVNRLANTLGALWQKQNQQQKAPAIYQVATYNKHNLKQKHHAP